MSFLSQMQKIVNCEVCGKEFLAIGDVNPDETLFCSPECSEKYKD